MNEKKMNRKKTEEKKWICRQSTRIMKWNENVYFLFWIFSFIELMIIKMHTYQDEWISCFSSCWIDWTFIHFVLFWNFFTSFFFKNKFTWTDEMYQNKNFFSPWFFVWTWKKLKNTNLYIPEQTIRDIGNKNQTMVEEYLHTQTEDLSCL